MGVAAPPRENPGSATGNRAKFIYRTVNILKKKKQWISMHTYLYTLGPNGVFTLPGTWTGNRTGTMDGTASMGSNMLCRERNVYIGLRQRQGPGHIVSYCGSPVPCTGCDPIPVQFE